jgi:hypothetical protein
MKKKNYVRPKRKSKIIKKKSIKPQKGLNPIHFYIFIITKEKITIKRDKIKIK